MKAFPMAHPSENTRFLDSGMDLRDYFAAKAMQGCVSLFEPNNFFNPEKLVKVSYQIADAMIEARK